MLQLLVAPERRAVYVLSRLAARVGSPTKLALAAARPPGRGRGGVETPKKVTFCVV